MLMIARILWFLLPAGGANIAASLFARFLPRLNYPIDCGMRWRGKRIFGDHKTWRGIIAGTLAGGAIFLLQRSLSPSQFFHTLELFDYKKTPWFLGFVMGFGALFGDLAKSFVKRRLTIAPGRSFLVFDQIDWVLGTIFAANLFAKIPLSVILLSLPVGALAHGVVKYIGHLIGLDKKTI